MLGTGPGSSSGEPDDPAGEAPEAEEAGDALADVEELAAAGIMPEACSNAAPSSALLMRTSGAGSPEVLGWSSLLTFSSNDCTFAAVAAGEAAGAATGAGLRRTRTRVKIEMARVARLMMRCH